MDERGSYLRPDPAERAAYRAAIAALLDTRIDDAVAGLKVLQLDVCELSLAESDTLLVAYDARGFERLLSRGWPAFVLRPAAPTRGASVVSAPHPTTERSIAAQAVDIITNAPSVRAIVLGPVDRCNRAELAPDEFQGETSECEGVYRVSDMAHNLDTLFQEAHEALMERHPEDHLVQIHGMSSAGVSVSHGDIRDVIDHPSMPSALVHSTMSGALASSGMDPEDLTTCSFHDGPGGGRFARRHCGTRNAQLAGLRARGLEQRFVHIEQSRVIRDDPIRRLAVAEAVHILSGFLFAHDFDLHEDEN